MKKNKINSSVEIARAMEKEFGKGEIISVPILYEEEVKKYIMEIEEDHKKAKKSKLKFD